MCFSRKKAKIMGKSKACEKRWKSSKSWEKARHVKIQHCFFSSSPFFKNCFGKDVLHLQSQKTLWKKMQANLREIKSLIVKWRLKKKVSNFM